MSRGLKIVEIAAVMSILVIVISISFLLANKGKNASNAVGDKISSTNVKISESDKTKYDGEELSGADVINAIKSNASNVIVSVQTITGADGTTLTSEYSLDTAYSAVPSDVNYINPNAAFSGAIERNSNDVITKIKFTQEKYVNNAVAWTGSDSGGGSGSGGNGGGTTSDDEVVTTLNGIAESLTNTISSLNTGLSAISANIQTISYNTDPNNQPEQTVKVDMTQVTAKLTDVADALEDLQNTMTTGIRGDSGDVEGPNLADISLSIAQLQEAIDALGTSGGSGSSGSGTSSDVDSTLDELQSSLTALTTAVSGVASDLQELSDFVMGDPDNSDSTSITSQLSDASDSIAALKKQLDTLETKIDTINKNLDGTVK